MSDNGPPVSISFFCGAEKLLRKQHGERFAGSWELMDKFRGLLGQAEEIYKSMPPVEKKKKSPKSRDDA